MKLYIHYFLNIRMRILYIINMRMNIFVYFLEKIVFIESVGISHWMR